ncbi:hypothetical protein HLH33_17240 [Gluconacetobacter diazotrophicus]|uniref:Uncharacterized protein n=1 Tax=Gluconacetobacter diazotrophicus TaxID=33996 RepID=A0A7W4I8A6_GLUDI|nr:hypothetical protein [Gluconacetobacter diazotrophicus]MBB2158017.1 hypothetical protein [Gluconacetobacter diazotrophicus]
MIDLTTISLDEFLCTSNQENLPASDSSFDEIGNSITALVGSIIRRLSADYAIHELNSGSAGDVLLLYNGEAVGCYWGDLLAISHHHTGQKLSVPLIIEGIKGRGMPGKRKVSEAGKRALTLAWNVANRIEPDPWP